MPIEAGDAGHRIRLDVSAKGRKSSTSNCDERKENEDQRIRRILRAVVDDMHGGSRRRVSHRRMNVETTKVLDGLELLRDSDIFEVLVAEDDDTTLRGKKGEVVESFGTKLGELYALFRKQGERVRVGNTGKVKQEKGKRTLISVPSAGVRSEVVASAVRRREYDGSALLPGSTYSVRSTGRKVDFSHTGR
jgi:hypothetical protein